MTISLSCPSCEHGLKVKDELAGRRVKCPKCGSAITIPSDEEDEEPAVTAGPPKKNGVPVKARAKREEDEEELEEEEEERPRKKKKKKKKKQGNPALLWGSVGGGVVVVVGLVLFFVLGAGGNEKKPAPVAQKPATPPPPPVAEEAKPEPKPKKGKDLISAVARRMEATEVNNWFRQLGLAYKQVETLNNKGPANFKELGREFANSPLAEWIAKDWVKVAWSARLSNLPNGSSDTLLAWETDADGQGNRVVLMCDGSVHLLPTAEFEKKAKAPGR